MTKPFLELRNIYKTYPGGIRGVVDLCYSLEKGSICAILGPNGAGKSTAMGIICGLCSADAGSILFEGSPVTPADPVFRRRIGVVSQHYNLEPDLTVQENLRIHTLLYNLDRRYAAGRIESLLSMTGLLEKRSHCVRTLSGGSKRRLQIIRALLHDPDLILLDEPTVGLDPAARQSLWQLMRSLARKGKTLLFSTHYMDEARRFADRISIMDEGSIIREGTLDSLVGAIGPWCLIPDTPERKETLYFENREAADRYAAGKGEMYVVRESTLDDVFIALTGKGLV